MAPCRIAAHSSRYGPCIRPSELVEAALQRHAAAGLVHEAEGVGRVDEVDEDLEGEEQGEGREGAARVGVGESRGGKGDR